MKLDNASGFQELVEFWLSDDAWHALAERSRW